MAEFTCYGCSAKVRTGEKFTFTKKGAVHFDCFVSSRRKEVPDDKTETLRSLSLLLDSQLDHLIDILAIGTVEGSAGDLIKEKYKDVEKGAGETTHAISDL